MCLTPGIRLSLSESVMLIPVCPCSLRSWGVTRSWPEEGERKCAGQQGALGNDFLHVMNKEGAQTLDAVV